MNVNLQTGRNIIKNYLIETEIYEGPLDILLNLIEKAELDITRLTLAKVTDQYLDYLHQIENRKPDEVSAFLVVAAKLLQIKSEALLPRPKQTGVEEEDLGETLALQLIAYKRYKQIAGWLADREESGLRTYLRLAPPPKIEGKLDLNGISIIDLISAAQSILLENTSDQVLLDEVVSIPLNSIRAKIRSILRLVQSQDQVKFSQLINYPCDRIEVVIAFLALLELIKRRAVEARQETLFSEIEFLKLDDYVFEGELDLDLGE